MMQQRVAIAPAMTAALDPLAGAAVNSHMTVIRFNHRHAGAANWNTDERRRMTLRARLHPKWRGGVAGYVYSVQFNGERVVADSRDPEHDLARVLLARGIIGKLTLCDGKTGAPRTIIDIEKAARFRVSEENRDGLRIRTVDPDSACYSPESEVARCRLPGGGQKLVLDRPSGAVRDLAFAEIK
jgi:hypothetical protein